MRSSCAPERRERPVRGGRVGLCADSSTMFRVAGVEGAITPEPPEERQGSLLTRTGSGEQARGGAPGRPKKGGTAGRPRRPDAGIPSLRSVGGVNSEEER